MKSKNLQSALLAALLTLSTHQAQAQCEQWDVGGRWVMIQGKHSIVMNLEQKGKALRGTANYAAEGDGGVLGDLFGTFNEAVSGSADGTIEGNNFHLRIYWPKGVVGVYQGEVGTQGRLRGTTFDRNNTASTASWYSKTLMECADKDVQPSRKPAPAATPRPVRKTPFFHGGPAVVVPDPGRDWGYARLSWDGGPEHPGAKVWVEVDSQTATVADTKAKETARPFKIDRGKTYVFSLRDGGRELGHVTIRGKPVAAEAAVPDGAEEETVASAEPFIRAGREVIRVPASQDHGWTHLSWDGGVDHPRAQLLMGIDDEAPKSVLKQKRGAKSFRIERGKTYVFVLADGAEELGSVTVRGE